MKKLFKNQLTELDSAGLAMVQATSLDGRYFKSNEKTIIDYCTTNYLGFDFNPHMHEKGTEYQKQWGSLTGWSRLEADPVIYSNLEKRIQNFLGSGEVILSHTITITNFSLIPAIAQKGVIFCDHKVHTVVYEACRLARDHGAELVRFQHQDLEDLEKRLIEFRDISPKIIAVDGVYSISTEFAPIPELLALCEKYDAWLYVDDAHGFGVLGSNPNEHSSYGHGGKGIIAHFNQSYDRVFYVTSFGKAYCTHTAFATVPKLYPDTLRDKCLQYIYSAPMSPYVIGMVDAALDLNEKIGHEERDKLQKITRHFVEGMRAMNLTVQNNSDFPVVFWEVGTLPQLIEVAKKMMEHGILAGLRAFPVVPEDECGFRFGLTSTHTTEQIEKTLSAIKQIMSECKFEDKNVA